jgi:hypothetical protein
MGFGSALRHGASLRFLGPRCIVFSFKWVREGVGFCENWGNYGVSALEYMIYWLIIGNFRVLGSILGSEGFPITSIGE